MVLELLKIYIYIQFKTALIHSDDWCNIHALFIVQIELFATNKPKICFNPAAN